MPGKSDCKKNAVQRVKARISRTGLDALIITTQNNIRYFTGLHFTGAILLISKTGKPVYFVDAMNSTLAERSLDTEKFCLVTAHGPAIKIFAEHIKTTGIKKLGFNDEDLSVAAHGRLSALLSGVKLVSMIKNIRMSSIVKAIRRKKNPEEIKILRKAAKETVNIWRKLKKSIRPGMTEIKIAATVDAFVKEKGYENSFPTIAAIGENSAYPHAIPTDRRLKENEHVLVDFGIKYNGYCSDLTRVCYKGRINRQIVDFREAVRKAHDLAVDLILPGVLAGSVARAAERTFDSSNNGGFILHGLGHGVGLDIHEEPCLHRSSRVRLEEGMVITIEPGLYKPGLGGVRHENMVLVSDKGCEVLTK